MGRTLGKRPPLDGLRGIAVVLVVLLHYTAALPALQPMFRGGFIGVEMFFVLSGFLITSLLLEEHAQTGDVDLRAFYKRRAYRLLPALYLMVLLCIALSAIHSVPRFGTTRDQL